MITISGNTLLYPDQIENKGEKMRRNSIPTMSMLLLLAASVSAQMRAYVVVGFQGPVELVVTDSQGHRSGYNPITKTYYDEIPYAGYGAGSDGQPEFGFKRILWDTLFSTTYTVQVFGTGNGAFTGDGIARQTQSGNGKGARFPVRGVIDSNQTVTYELNYSTDSTITPTMVRVVDPSTTTQDITDLLKLNLITNHGIANSLQQKMDNAWKQKENGQVSTAGNMVNAFINEVNAQTGKAIIKEAAEILLGDAEQLLKEWNQ